MLNTISPHYFGSSPIHHTEVEARLVLRMISEPNYAPTEDEIEMALKSSFYPFRLIMAARRTYTPTREQVDRGLADENVDVVKLWLERCKEQSEEELEYGEAFIISI